MKKLSFPVIIIFIVFAFGLISNLAMAEQVEIEVDEYRLIYERNSGYPRILIKPDLIVPDNSLIINHATLSVRIPQINNPHCYIHTKFHPIISEWDFNDVGWSYPWEKDGGDFDEIYYGEKTITFNESRVIEIDLTDICQRWADGRIPYHGLIFIVNDYSFGHGNFIRGWEMASITVNYTVIEE